MWHFLSLWIDDQFQDDSKLFNRAVGRCLHGEDELLGVTENRFCSVASSWDFVAVAGG